MRRASPVEDVLVHREADEVLLLHVSTGRYFGLNPAGAVVWDALVSGTEPAHALNERWPSRSLEQCRLDAAELIRALDAAGLLQPEPPVRPS